MLAFPGSALAFGPLSSFGTFGSGAGQLDSPQGVAVGPDGTVYVADIENHRVTGFEADGSFLQAMGSDVDPGGGDICTALSGCKAGVAGSSPRALTVPIGVAFGPEGRLFVSDANNNRVAVYASNGTFKYLFGTTHLHEPRGIQFDSSGLLYVANRSDNRVDVFTPGGAFVRGIGKEVNPDGGNVCTEETGCQAGPPADGSAGAMAGPQDVAFGPAGELIVADGGNRRVDVFASDGTFLHAFGKEVDPVGGDDVCTIACQAGSGGAAPGAFESPVDVAADVMGKVYVADRLNGRVSVSWMNGSFVDDFAVAAGPFGVTLDCRGGVWVSEASASFARVERFGEPGTLPPPCRPAPAPTLETILESSSRPPSNRFRFVGLIKNRSNGSAVLFVRVPGPGKLFLWGRGVRRLRRTAPRMKTVRLPVKPKIPLKRFLKQHGRGRIRVNVSFEPSGGEVRTREKVIVLKRRKKG
ncbi:MAG: NHL repeat-containing protein [Solirubrobacterales bacterium]